MMKLGVDSTPAPRARSMSPSITGRITLDLMQARIFATSTPERAASDSKALAGSGIVSHCGCASKSASCICQNLSCAAAHIAASAAGIAFTCLPRGKLM